MMTQIFNRFVEKWVSLTKSRELPWVRRNNFFSFFPLALVGAFITGLCLSLLFAACTPTNSSNPTAKTVNSPTLSKAASVVRIGYQKTAILYKAKGVLEKRLEPQGVSVKWTEFAAGPQLLEAMNAGSIDFGHAGETPPVFAQAAGASLTYLAGIAASPAGSAVLVPKNSPIQKVADLKGKKVAFQKGSSAHYLIVQILEKEGLQYTDIQPVFLPPADARAAFVKGSVDAWVIWDPFYAAAEKGTNSRVLVDGQGVTKQGGYYIGTRKFATENQETLKAILEEIKKLDDWSSQHRDEVAATLAPVLGVDLETLKKATNRKIFGVKQIDSELIEIQQKVADTFYQLKVIPKKIDVKEAMLPVDQYVAISPK